MTDTDTWFLLVQFKNLGTTRVTEFADAAEAAEAYSAAETRYKKGLRDGARSVDVLLVGASSLDVVKNRYPSYFVKEKTRTARIKSLLDSIQMPAVNIQ